MSIQFVDKTAGKSRAQSNPARQDVHISPVFKVEELLFHVQQGNVVTLFLGADWSAFGPDYKNDYLSTANLEVVAEDLQRESLFSSPPNRTEMIEESFPVQFTENIFIQNSSGQQRIISAWTDIQTPLLPPLGSRLKFGPIKRDFEVVNHSIDKSLSPFDDERIVTRIFHSNVNLGTLGGHIHMAIESDLLYEVDVADFEAEVERIAQALVRKHGFQLNDTEK